MKPCQGCQRGIHDEQLDANGGYCADCKPPAEAAPKKTTTTKADADSK